MQGVYLKFYLTEKQQHQGRPLHEWLLGKAKALGVPGGSVYRAIAGFGRHGHLHAETFFELGGEMPVQVEFVLEPALAGLLIKSVSDENFKIPYISHAVDYGVTGQ